MKLDDILDRHIAIAPHFSVHLQDPDRVLLLSEERSFRLRGQFYRDLLAWLDGSRTPQAIIDAHRGHVDPAQMKKILGDMLGKGYIAALASPEDRHIAAYHSARGVAPLEAEQKLKAKRFGVVALGNGAPSGVQGAATLISLLTGSGLAVSDDQHADILFVLVDDYLQGSLESFAARMAETGQSWIPVKPGGNAAWIGPRMGPGTLPSEDLPGIAAAKEDLRRPCFHCLTRRLIGHRPGDTLVAAPAGGLRPARGWTAGSLALAFGHVVGEAARQARAEESHADRHLVTVDTATGEIETHRAPRFADCSHCGPGAETADRETTPVPIELGSVAAHGDGDGGWRALTAEEALARLEPMVSPLTGIISRVDGRELAPGIHVTMAIQANAERVDPRANRQLGKPGNASGKGISPVQARVSCLAEAIERYACGWTGSEQRRKARYVDLGDEAVHPGSYLGFSERQYTEREARNKTLEAMHFIPHRFREEAEVEWSPAWSLTHGTPRWLPTRSCYFDYRAEDVSGDHVFAMGDSNGCAAGGTLDEAILQGLLEVVERDAVAIWWYNQLSRPAADLSEVDKSYLAAMRDYHDAQNRSLEVLDLTTDLGIPVMAAVSGRLTDGGGIALGLGAHVDATVAATRALTELNQIHVFNEHLGTGGSDEWSGAKEWFENAVIDDHRYMQASGAAPTSHAAGDALARRSIGDAVRHCVDRIADNGHEVIVFDFARAHLPLECVRVVAPGLVHFWNRRGAPRLFNSPVEQGILDRPRTEEELNPLPFFI